MSSEKSAGRERTQLKRAQKKKICQEMSIIFNADKKKKVLSGSNLSLL